MNAHDYLSQVGKLQHKLDMMQLRADEYNRLASSVPGPNYGEKIGSNPNRNTDAPFVKWVCKLLDLEKEMEGVRAKLDETKAEAIGAIEKIDDENFKSVLMLHYISLLSFPEICDKLYISLPTVKRWNRCGLEKIEVPKVDTP